MISQTWAELTIALLAVPISLVSVWISLFYAVKDVLQGNKTVRRGIRRIPVVGKKLVSSLAGTKRSGVRNVLITGASSGIGQALALKYATTPGSVLVLTGRNRERLQRVAKQCRTLGAKVEVVDVDITNVHELERQLLTLDTKYPFDLVIANAGVCGRTLVPTTATVAGGEQQPPASASIYDPPIFLDMMKPMVQVNLVGTIATVQPLLERMIQRKSGQIALTSSIAGLVTSMPSSPTYACTKAALVAWASSLRPALEQYNVRMNVICPGFVDTPMTEQVGKQIASSWKSYIASMVTVGDAADAIVAGLEKNVPLIAFPFDTYVTMQVLGKLPYRFQLWVAQALWKSGVLPADEL